jgi:hypothetical protein
MAEPTTSDRHDSQVRGDGIAPPADGKTYSSAHPPCESDATVTLTLLAK